VTARIAVHPLTVALDLRSSITSTGKVVQARATVTNHGRTTARDVAVTLRLAPAGLVVNDTLTQPVLRLRAGRTAKVDWSVCAAAAGSYLLLAQATLDGFIVDSATRVLTVSAGRRGC
jgi:hypothetical protein